MLKVYTWILAHLRNERGQDLIEYAMLSGLIAAALVAVLALGVLTGAVTGMANGVSDCVDFNSATTCAAGF